MQIRNIFKQLSLKLLFCFGAYLFVFTCEVEKTSKNHI